MKENEFVMSVEQVAEYLNIGRSLAYEAVRSGQIPCFRIGNSYRVPRAKLDALLAMPDYAPVVPKPSTPKEWRQSASFSLTRDLREKLIAAAADNHRSMSKEIEARLVASFESANDNPW
jgi:excisionase family DNA binding protein